MNSETTLPDRLVFIDLETCKLLKTHLGKGKLKVRAL